MYVIMKDGLYLMGIQNLGIKEFDSEGNYVEVPTGIYGTREQDALLVENTKLAGILGGKAIKASKGRARK